MPAPEPTACPSGPHDRATPRAKVVPRLDRARPTTGAPEHRSYFFRRGLWPLHFSTCVRRPGARGDVPWVYSRQKLHALARLAVIGPCGFDFTGQRVRSHLVGGRWCASRPGRSRPHPDDGPPPNSRRVECARAPWPDHRLPIDGVDAVTRLLLAVVALTVVFGLGPARAEMLAPTSPLGPTYSLRSTLRPQNVVGPRPHVSRSAKGVFSAELRPRWRPGGKDQSAPDTRRHHGARHVRPHSPRKRRAETASLSSQPQGGPAQSDSADGELHLAGRLPLTGPPRGADLHRRPHQGQSAGELRGQITVERIS